MTVKALDPARVTRAAEALAGGAMRIEPGPKPSTFVVQSFSGEDSYLVDLERGTCTCPDATYHGRRCKHHFAVLLGEGGR